RTVPKTVGDRLRVGGPEDLFGDERRLDADPAIERPEDLAGSVHDRQPGGLALAAIAETDGRLDPRVGQARDRLGHARIIRHATPSGRIAPLVAVSSSA